MCTMYSYLSLKSANYDHCSKECISVIIWLITIWLTSTFVIHLNLLFTLNKVWTSSVLFEDFTPSCHFCCNEHHAWCKSFFIWFLIKKQTKLTKGFIPPDIWKECLSLKHANCYQNDATKIQFVLWFQEITHCRRAKYDEWKW